LTGKAPYKNVIVNGIVLASDGTKMSKSKANYEPPSTIISKYGADTVRYYLLSSPATHAEDIQFDEKNIQPYNKTLFQLINILNLLQEQIDKMPHLPTLLRQFSLSTGTHKLKTHLDIWIFFQLKITKRLMQRHFNHYNLAEVTKHISTLITSISRYVNLNKHKIKIGDEFSLSEFHNIAKILTATSIMFAPIVPFVTEFIFQTIAKWYGFASKNLTIHIPKTYQTPNEPMHFLLKPASLPANDHAIYKQTEHFIQTLNAAETLRHQILPSPKTFTSSITIITNTPHWLTPFSPILESQLRTMKIIITDRIQDYFHRTYEPNLKHIRPKYKAAAREIIERINSPDFDPATYSQPDDYIITYKPISPETKSFSVTPTNATAIIIDTEMTPETLTLTRRRFLVNQIMMMKKISQMVRNQPFVAIISTQSQEFQSFLKQNIQEIESELVVGRIKINTNELPLMPPIPNSIITRPFADIVESEFMPIITLTYQ
jgi:isoleucyl-tRNA synthetase